MADGVVFTSGANSTPPANTKAATDDCGSAGHVGIAKLAVSANGDATVIPADDDGLFVQTVDRVASPQHTVVAATGLSAGGTSVLNAADITTSKTGRLAGVDVASSVPFRCDVETVSGARVTRTTVYGQAGQTVQWRPPSPRYLELVGAAGVHFGATVTNLDASETADIRATIYWDEVT